MDKLFIRVDMNPMIATGHVMRCLAIADAAGKLGTETVFIVADNFSVELISSRGYEIIVLDSVWDDLNQEIDLMKQLVKERDIKKLFIDSYFVTYEYLNALNNMTEVSYLDDLNMFNYPVSKLFCYASYYKKFDYKTANQGTKLFLGCKYAPVRAEFQNLNSKNISEDIKNILIMSGGTDRYHVVIKLLEMFSESHDNYNIVAICGRYNDDYSEMEERYKKDESVRIYKAADNLIDYMKWADVAITAGGTTIYELCACGTPSVSYAVADNQFDNVRQFSEDGLIDYAGDVRCESIFSNVKNAIDRLKSAEVRKDKSDRMRELVDGNGAKAFAQALIL